MKYQGASPRAAALHQKLDCCPLPDSHAPPGQLDAAAVILARSSPSCPVPIFLDDLWLRRCSEQIALEQVTRCRASRRIPALRMPRRRYQLLDQDTAIAEGLGLALALASAMRKSPPAPRAHAAAAAAGNALIITDSLFASGIGQNFDALIFAW